MGAPDLADAVDRSAVEAVPFPGSILNLQARFYVLDGCCDEGDGRTGQDARHAVTMGRQGQGIGVVGRMEQRGEDMVAQETAVDGQGAEHDAVHEHPADEGWRRAFVEPGETFIADGLEDTLERAGEAVGGGGLETNLDGVERMADCWGMDRTGQSTRGVLLKGPDIPRPPTSCLPESFAIPEKTPATKPR